MTNKSTDTSAPALFQFQTINHYGSFINYGPATRTVEWCNARRDKGRGVEGQHFRFVRVN